MAMLAEPRRKQKWTLNPRGKEWSDDSNKFGQKMLEKMGWSSGKGLGRNLHGTTEHVRARYKNDQCGIGFSDDDKTKQWTLHRDGYNRLLRELRKDESTEALGAENALSGKSLELRSKQSRARLHYRKFTRGKDVNKYTTKDLANIFGKKSLSEKSRDNESAKVKDVPEANDSIFQPVGSTDTSYGVMTIKGGTFTDYFRTKMSVLGRKTSDYESNDVIDEGESDDRRHTGFGFVGSRVASEKSSATEKHTFENGTVDNENYPPRIIERNSYRAFENAALELGDGPTTELERAPKRREREFAFDNAGLDIESTESCQKKPLDDRVAARGNIARVSDEIVQGECPTNGKSGQSSEKKSRKKRKKDVVAVAEGFTNEAINLRVDDGETCDSRFQVPSTCFGLANEALDLTDESTGKKRVTFNETIEYNVNVGKPRGKKSSKHAAAKLDKFEVDNDKAGKKKNKAGKKHSGVVSVDGAFANEAMDIEISIREANDNVLNERKVVRARRKRDRRVTSLETIEEAPEEDKGQRGSPNIPIVVSLQESLVGEASEGLEILWLDTPKRERKKRRKDEERDTRQMIGNHVEFIREIVSSRGNDHEKSNKRFEPDTNETTNYNGDYGDDESRGAKKRKRDKRFNNVEFGRNEASVRYNDNIEEEESNGKSKRKSKKSIDKENVGANDENTEMAEAAGERKKSKKSKKRKRDEIKASEANEIDETSRDITDQCSGSPKQSTEIVDGVASGQTEVEILHSATRSPWDNRGRKSRNMLKALFAKSPVLHFAGSNINEIKGYGMDFN